MIKYLRKPAPTYRELVQNRLDTAEIMLLDAHAEAERAQANLAKYASRVARLKAELAKVR